MRIIASTGVKGGVGKSTFAVLLSLKLSKEKKVLLLDADVECPNDYILLRQNLGEPIEFTYQEFPEIDKQKCKKCGTCGKVCKEHAILCVPNKYPILIKDLCSGCGVCKLACPFGAIKMKKEISGRIYVNQVNKNLWLITGISETRISEVGPIVKQVRDFALKFAKEKQIEYVVIDTSPGTHCNVIQALLPAEKMYIVTEPTPLGAHDLRIMLQLASKLNKKVEIVLNKANIGNRMLIEKISRDFNVPISIEIPYSEELVKFYSEGNLEKMLDKINLIIK